MPSSRSFAALVVLVGLGAAAFGQDAVTMKWKFEKNKTFYQTMSTTTKQDMKVMGQPVNQTQEQTFYFSWTVKDQDKDKNWVLLQKIEGVKMRIEVAGNPINYDSTKPDANANNPLADFFKAIVGSEFTITVTPETKVVKVEGKDKFIDNLSKANSQLKPLLEQILSDDALKQMADPSFGAIPNKPVKKGDKWTAAPVTLAMGPIGTYKTTNTYTFEGTDEKDKNLDRIKEDTALEYTPPAATAASSLPFQIKSADLKSKDATGSVVFDNQKGRIASSKTSLKLEGALTMTIQGQDTEVQLSQTQETSVQTSDDNPVKAASGAR